MTTTAAPSLPPEFRRAVAGLQQANVRSGIQLGTLPAPGVTGQPLRSKGVARRADP